MLERLVPVRKIRRLLSVPGSQWTRYREPAERRQGKHTIAADSHRPEPGIHPIGDDAGIMSLRWRLPRSTALPDRR